MPLTKITKVGAFSDDVAKQINDNFALLGATLLAQGAKLDQPPPPQSAVTPELNLKYPEPEKEAAEPDDSKKSKNTLLTQGAKPEDKHDHKR